MAKVRCSPELAGSAVNVPHSEHRVSEDTKGWEKNSVTFDTNGYATVSKTLAAALLEFYPNQIRLV